MNVQFHIQRGDLFFGYDRHGEDKTLWLPWGDPFICAWDQEEGIDGARRHCEPGDKIRVSINGKLF